MTRIAHLSTVHKSRDIRIFYKECKSLSKSGYEVKYIVPTNEAFVEDGVEILGVSPPRSRAERMLLGPIRVFVKALQTKAEIVHFHDPELMFVGTLFKLFGRKVIYDAHEDLPRQIAHKHWVPPGLRSILGRAMELLETLNCLAYDKIVAATPLIAARFPAAKTTLVQNFPLIEEFSRPQAQSIRGPGAEVIYIGVISEPRGILQLVETLALVNKRTPVRCNLAGEITPASLRRRLTSMPGWAYVNFSGWLDRNGITELLSESQIGILTLHPYLNYIESLPIKMFEYMAAGIPVIASNFPLWKEILEGAECGIVVDPHSPEAISEAIIYLLKNPERARTMGENGRRAVQTEYNWESEAKKLVHAYADLSRARLR